MMLAMPGLVLEREEHEALGRTWTLTRDDGAGDADAPPVRPAGRSLARSTPRSASSVRPQRHRMRPDGQARAGIVGQQALAGVIGTQRR